MIYLVYGEDSFRAREFIDTLEIPDKTIVDNAAKIDEIFKNFAQANLFGTPKLVVFHNLLGKIEYEHLEKLDRKQHEVVFWEDSGKVDQRKKVVKTLLKGAVVKKFKPLPEREVRQWIELRMKNLEFRMEANAVTKLIQLHGSNLWFIKNELDKLKAYARSKKEAAITAKDVEKLASSSLEEDIFQFTDAVGERKSELALQLFQNLLDQHADEHYLFAMIVWQFRLLIQAKDGSLTGQHPFVIKKSTQQAANWEMEELIEIYNQLTQIDHRAKTGRADLKTALTLFLAEL